MATATDFFYFLNVILAIIFLLLLFAAMGLFPLIISKLLDKFGDFIERKNFLSKLMNALDNNMIDNLGNVEAIFSISCPALSKSKMKSFFLKTELSFFLGLLNSKYHGIVYREINFSQRTSDELKQWRTLIENIIVENNKKLNYADLPYNDQIVFKPIFDFFEQNPNICEGDQQFIKSRLLDIKQTVLQKNKAISRSNLLNYGAFFVSVVSVILTIIFGLKIIGT